MKTNIQKQRLHFYRIAMSLSCTLIIWAVFCLITDTHASSAEYTIKICTKTMWWVNYLEGRKKTCDLIWRKISYDTLNTNN